MGEGVAYGNLYRMQEIFTWYEVATVWDTASAFSRLPRMSTDFLLKRIWLVTMDFLYIRLT